MNTYKNESCRNENVKLLIGWIELGIYIYIYLRESLRL